MIVKDRDGKVLHEVEGVNFLDCLDLRRADFSGQVLEGIYLDDSDLREADFTGADLYWAIAFRTNFEDAILKNAQLGGASLREAKFRGADLRGAYISLDNLLGSPTLEGADLTDALMDGAVLIGCEYNELTRFPSGFDSESRGMIRVEIDHTNHSQDTRLSQARQRLPH